MSQPQRFGVVSSVMFLTLLVGCVTTTKPITQSDLEAVEVDGSSFIDTKIRKYTQLAREFPEEPKYQERLARLHWENRDHQNALKHVAKARKLDAGNAKYDFIEGRIYLGIGNFNRAEKAYRRMIDHTPEGFPGGQ